MGCADPGAEDPVMRVSNIPVMIGPNPVRLPERADPTAIPNTGQLYTNDVSGYTELMYQNDVGGELQITTSTAAGRFLNGTAVSLGAAAAGRGVYTAADGTLTTEAAFAYAAATDTLTVGSLVLAGRAQLQDGSAANLSWSFTTLTTGTGTGMFFGGVSGGIGRLSVALNGATRAEFNALTHYGLSLGSSSAIMFGTGYTNEQVALVRHANGGLEVQGVTAVATGILPIFTVTAIGNTNQTLSTEISGVNFNLSATRQWATGAGPTLQREYLIQGPTYGAVGASTFPTAVTFEVSGSPLAGAT